MESQPHDLKEGMWVRLIGDPQRFGTFQGKVERAGRILARVQFPEGLREIPVQQLEPMPMAREEPIDFLRAGRFSDPDRLRQVLAHIRLTGRLADVIYSMEATNTDFYAHQFKPVLKMLSSPTGNLLIADEVGLGKTIEAGLIWTELRARFDYRRLLIVCPKAICEKWELELRSKFAVDARIVSAADLLRMLENESAWSQGFVAISSLQGLRPLRGWRDEVKTGAERASNRLARLLDERSSDEPQFDMVVVDEAHHLRNPDTQSNQVTRLLRPLTKHLVFLSATPIHLRNKDLFSLLSLIDPETFRDPQVLEEVLSANRPLIEAREALLAGRSVEEVREIAEEAARIPLLAESQQLRTILAELQGWTGEMQRADRARLGGRFEQANLLANVINRTRRRDVEEFRVLRKVYAYPAEMGALEREVYDAITAAVQQYARKTDIPAGFLLSTPQRLLASCLPAAIEHWRHIVANRVEESEEDEDGADYQPLVAAIRPVAMAAPDLHTLESNDSKFLEFIRVLRQFLDEEPGEKVIVFSSFRPTIAYLERRLNSTGIVTKTIHGGTPDRTAAIEVFRTDPAVRVLLSSEVGSEGIDLQFARTIVNYDLPWNPMKIEQRIGRVDRLGQTSDFVTVINLYHRDTIDSEIYRRLYERLRLCERALGGFEAVLGAEIARLTPELLTGRLNRDDIAARFDQAFQALENKLKIEEQLEQEAVALIAHGDHVLQSIHAARDMHRWIDGKDLAQYLRDALTRLYPGSEIRELDDGALFDIRLSDDARMDFGAFLDGLRLPRGRFFRGRGAVRCRLGRPPGGQRLGRSVETVTQTHPLVRFISSRVTDTDAPKLRPAIAAKVGSDKLPGHIGLKSGLYAVAAQFWRFGGVLAQERIAYAGLRIGEEGLLNEDAAEALMLATASDGTLWIGAEEEVDVDAIAASCDRLLFERLSERFKDEAEARQAELDDRAAIQMRTLGSRLSEQRASLMGLIERQRARIDLGEVDPVKAQNVIRMNEGRLRSLEEKAAAREVTIKRGRRQTEQSEQLAIAVIELMP